MSVPLLYNDHMTTSDDRSLILIIEDDETLRESLRYTLTHEGYDVVAVADGLDGLRSAREREPSLVLLDLMLPGMGGMDVCKRIRRGSNVPILMLTARREELDKIDGLDAGADDYLTKPFSMRELTARMRALLRRSTLETGSEIGSPSVITSGDLVIDLGRREVRLRTTPLTLTPKEFDLLSFFARHPGRVFGREELLDRVWGYDFAGGSRTVDVHVRWLREKIEDEPGSPSHLTTVRGTGYRFDS